MVPPKNHVELSTLKFRPSEVTKRPLHASRSAEGCCENPAKLAAPSAPRLSPPSFGFGFCVRGVIEL